MIDRTRRLLGVVLLNGLIVMAVEMIAGRLVTPFFGSTVYTWGTVIGVYMGALSAGYYAGGRLTDHYPTGRVLSVALIAVSISILLMKWGYDPVMRMAQAYLGHSRYDVLWPSLLVFGPVALSGGLVSPTAIADLKQHSRGRAAGLVYAIGTIGSLAGVFGALYALIPFFQVDTILLLLLGGSVLNLLLFSPRWLMGGVAGVVLLFGLIPGPKLHASNLLMRTLTPYQALSVYETENERLLFLGGTHTGVSSSVNLSDPEALTADYARLLAAPFYADPSIKNGFIMGGGGLKFSDHLLRNTPDLELTVAEIDPAVVRAGYRLLKARRSDRRTVRIADARQVLKRGSSFDAIVMDAYRHEANIPFHLTTSEFFSMAHERLRPGGYLLVNYIGRPNRDQDRLFKLLTNTISRHFPSGAYAHQRSAGRQNIVLFFRKDQSLPPRSIRKMIRRSPFRDALRTVIVQPLTRSGPTVLTDGWAPVNSF